MYYLSCSYLDLWGVSIHLSCGFVAQLLILTPFLTTSGEKGRKEKDLPVPIVVLPYSSHYIVAPNAISFYRYSGRSGGIHEYREQRDARLRRLRG